MKCCIRKITGILLCLILFAVPLQAFADEWDEPYTETQTESAATTTQPAQTTTTTRAPETTIVYVTMPTEATTVGTTKEPLAEEPPLVKITRENLPTRPKAGETFTLTVVIHNYRGSYFLRPGLVSFEPSDGIALAENSASKVVPVIGPSSKQRAKIKLRVTKEAESDNQFVSVTYAYKYETSEGLQEAEAEEKLILPIVPVSASDKSTAASATPNIIVTGYNYGGTIAAGDSFDLDLQFQNTSGQLKVENIVMAVEVGEGLTITSTSNTYFFPLLEPGENRSQRIPMRVAVNANADGARIEISFKYEYVDNGTRSNSTTSERLSIPIKIPDRFTVTKPESSLVGIQNEELSLSLPYVNKSRVAVNNVSALLVFDEESISCEQPRINLGNIESGKSGSIDFFFTPLEAGDGSVTVQITYEDELSNEKQVEIPVPFSADEAIMDLGMDEPMDIPEEESGLPLWAWIVIIAAAVLVIVVIIVLVRKHKKKNSNEPSADDFDWGVPQEVNTHEDP